MTEQLGEAIEVFTRTNVDSKGRVFGYIVGLRKVLNTNECYAWVQRGVETKEGFKDFGVVQRSKKFPSYQSAKNWAYSTQKERIEKIAA